MMASSIVVFSQRLETTITINGTKARITVRAAGGDVSGNASNFVFSVAIPVANQSATMTVTVLDATRLPTSLTPIVSYTDAMYKYFNLTYTGANATTTTWTNGTAYDLLELNFSGSTPAPLSLTSLPDGNPSAPAAAGNWFNYLELSGTGYSDPQNMFYQSANTGTPTQAIDYSTGIAIITTNSNISLPVNMLNFSGYKNGGKNTLRWTTVTEINNVGFNVTRSTDGMNYSSIGFVNSLAQGGASNSTINYTFDDNSPVGKKQYYRLEQKDIDGNSKLSNIVVISGDRPTQLNIGGLFPNPARDNVNVIIEAPQRDRITILVADMGGKTVKQQMASVELGSNTVPVDVAKLASGSYLIKLKCESSDCETASAKFNKQ